jgi:hypothetical protein
MMENFKKEECKHLAGMKKLSKKTRKIRNLNRSEWALEQIKKANCYEKEDGEFSCQNCPLTIHYKCGILTSDGDFVEIKVKPIETIEECLEEMVSVIEKYDYIFMIPYIEFLEEKFEEMSKVIR